MTEKTNKSNKPRVAIYDFTDCEGCEVKLVSLREKLLLLENKIDIVNWRLGQEYFEPNDYFLTIIEGTAVTQHEIDLLKDLRKESKVLVALGACAALGGIPGMMPKKDRRKWYDKIYSPKYKPKGIDAPALSEIVDVDYTIHGCPVDEDEVVKVISDLLAGKTPRYKDYSVCFECKQAGNPCRIAEEKKPCMGPITQGGCKAVCISGGSPCYGCFGIREEANISALKKILNKIADPKIVERYLTMFHTRTKEINEKK